VICAAADQAKTDIEAEIKLGQISREVERCLKHSVTGVYHAGGAMIPPEPILKAIQEAAR
jgi:hypothetical protein